MNERSSKLRLPVDSNSKVLITGPGRSGTTFLVSLISALGYDTGFSEQQLGSLDRVSRAGLERGIYKAAHKNSPLSDAYIIKSPFISETLGYACSKGDLHVEHVYIPVRDMRDIAQSRERGGFWGASSVPEQEEQIARSFFTLINVVANYDLPHTFLYFPRLVMDPEYLYRKLFYLVGSIEYEFFLGVFNRVARPEWIHSFKSTT